MNSPQHIRTQLSDLFGTYRAEWLQERLFDLFTEPLYFPELTTRQSCVLVGGRGTGKTTVLRSLSYEGQCEFASRKGATFDAVTFIGVYHRINTNHVTAFQGGGLGDEEWIRLFAHYFNILLCELLLEFIKWYEIKHDVTITLDANKAHLLCRSLHLPKKLTHADILESLIESRVDFEAYVNNVTDGDPPKLSLQQSPVELLCSYLRELPPFSDKYIFFLLDEYENLLEYQQRVVNTFIKHSNTSYFFKIGVRELGWACRSTLRTNEQLISPADYALVPIAERLQGESFSKFARAVCETRLDRVRSEDGNQLPTLLDSALPSLPAEEEAKLLGVSEHQSRILEEYENLLSTEQLACVKDMSALELFFFDGWRQAKKTTPDHLLNEILTNE